MAWLQPHAQAWARRASNMTEHNISNVDITKATTIRSPIPPHGRQWPVEGRNNNAGRGILWRKQSFLHTHQPVPPSWSTHRSNTQTHPQPHVCVPLAQSTFNSKK